MWRRLTYQERYYEGIACFTIVGDFAGVVLADSIVGADTMAGYMAFVDSVSYCGDCRGGVSFAAQVHSVFARKITRPSG